MNQEKQEKINGAKSKEKKESKDAKVIIFVDLQQGKEEYYEEFSFKTETKAWL